MIKIRRLTLFDIDQLRSMIEQDKLAIAINYVSERNFTPFPLDIIHELLPVSKRFLQESYVAIDDNEILGIIGLLPDGKQRSRWKINVLILHRDSELIGKQLIDFAIAKYGALGVQTFIAVVDDDNFGAINIFKNECNFRSCAKVQTWQLENLEHINESFDSKFFRKAKRCDSKSSLEMDTQNIYPQFRNALVKTIKDFYPSFTTVLQNKLNNYRPKYIVLGNPENKNIEGFFTLLTSDYKNFWLDATISLPYKEYFSDVLKYAIEYSLRNGVNPKLNVYVKYYYQSSNTFIDMLKEFDFKPVKTQEVFVKDYWMPIKLEDQKKSTVVIFPDSASPA